MSGIDYGRLAEGRDCNYWELDPTLRFEARRVYPDDEFEWAEEDTQISALRLLS